VLVPSVLADTLLRCAEQELYRPVWSATILDEVRRNLPASVNDAAAERRVTAMRRHFPEAMVSGYEDLIDQMDNDPKDRHVLAAAVVAGAEFIVTANLRDFPPRALQPRAVEALHPDDFLCDLYDAAPDQVVEVIIRQAEATGKAGRPKLTVGDILDGLAGCRVVRFGYRVDAELSGRA
jgi:predicted nucleic acid-binding protein